MPPMKRKDKTSLFHGKNVTFVTIKTQLYDCIRAYFAFRI